MSDYEVGYGKPPKHTQFAPKTSGNRKGRPPRPERFSVPRQMREDILRAMEEEVTIKVGGKVKKTTLGQLIIKSVLQKAVSGNPTAMKMAMKMMADALESRLAANGPVRLLDDHLDHENKVRARLHEWDDNPDYDIKKTTKDIY